jgi:hypothetical protein
MTGSGSAAAVNQRSAARAAETDAPAGADVLASRCETARRATSGNIVLIFCVWFCAFGFEAFCVYVRVMMMVMVREAH